MCVCVAVVAGDGDCHAMICGFDGRLELFAYAAAGVIDDDDVLVVVANVVG